MTVVAAASTTRGKQATNQQEFTRNDASLIRKHVTSATQVNANSLTTSGEGRRVQDIGQMPDAAWLLAFNRAVVIAGYSLCMEPMAEMNTVLPLAKHFVRYARKKALVLGTNA